MTDLSDPCASGYHYVVGETCTACGIPRSTLDTWPDLHWPMRIRSALRSLLLEVDTYAAMCGIVPDEVANQFFIDHVGSASCVAHNALEPGSHECSSCPHDPVGP